MPSRARRSCTPTWGLHPALCRQIELRSRRHELYARPPSCAARSDPPPSVAIRWDAALRRSPLSALTLNSLPGVAGQWVLRTVTAAVAPTALGRQDCGGRHRSSREGGAAGIPSGFRSSKIPSQAHCLTSRIPS
jgi:hypothetical protein